MSNNSITTIENKSQLIQYFIDGIKKNSNQRIGVEHEKFLFSKNDLKRINYNQLKQVFDILKKCIWEVHHGDVIHNRVDVTDSDIEEFIDNFTTEQFEKVTQFFNTMPKLRHEVEVTNPKTKVKGKVIIEGLDNFLE